MLSPNDIYQITNKNASGVDGYDCPRFYHDPAGSMRNKELLKQIEKHQAHKRYETKRGNYLDDYVKIYQINPSPLNYQTYKLKQPPNVKISYPQKQSIFDEMIKKAKKRKEPGVGNYNLAKSQIEIDKELKQLKTKKIKSVDRTNPYENDMALSIMVPGPGAYNPHPILPKIKQNNTKPKDWISKHSKLKHKSVPQLPPVGTYSPMMKGSFDKLQTETPTKRNYWGGEKRFKGLWNSGEMSPGPGTYAQLSKQLAKGNEKSIYQD